MFGAKLPLPQACVSANVSKVKQLTMTARPQLLQALRSREIRIHRAWLWSKEPSDKQLGELRRYRDNRAANKIKRLISQHKVEGRGRHAFDPSCVVRRLAGLDSNEFAAVSVRVVKGSGKAIYLTEELIQPSHRTRSRYRHETQAAADRDFD